jgi:hypothetical protein
MQLKFKSIFTFIMDCDIWGYYTLKVHHMVHISNLIVISLGINIVTIFFIDLNTISQSCENLNLVIISVESNEKNCHVKKKLGSP